ncbi:MAG: hypothetical protein ACTSVI_06785 [Promethearchaeota archaeon]
MTKTDTIKFFQSFIAQMIEIGGINLPRSIATKLGRNLGDLYKKKGVGKFSDAIKAMFKGMGGDTKDFKETEDGFIITVEYPTNFCPIGGNYKPKRFNMFTEAICRPYAVGFLSAFGLHKIKVQVVQCILKDNEHICSIEAALK